MSELDDATRVSPPSAPEPPSGADVPTARLAAPLAEGASLPRFSAYSVERLLGRGGMGAVYLARQKAVDRTVVVKVIAEELAKDPVVVERLRREAQAIGKIDSPHVVKVIDAGEDAGLPFISMEFIDGTSVASRLDELGRLPVAEATRICIEAARGLAAAHAQGILHRDVKPANMLLARDGTVKLVDFGIAKVKSTPGGPQTLSATGDVIGTPDYMPPEQADGKTLDERADVYALGVTYYQLLTGRLPFRGASVLQTLSNVIKGKPELPSRIEPSIPPTVERACLRLMSADRERRPRKALEAIDLLVAASEGRATPTTVRGSSGRAAALGSPAKASSPGLVPRPPREEVKASSLVASGLVVAVLGASGWVALRRPPAAATAVAPPRPPGPPELPGPTPDESATARDEPSDRHGEVASPEVAPTPTRASASTRFDADTAARLREALVGRKGEVLQALGQGAPPSLRAATEHLYDLLAGAFMAYQRAEGRPPPRSPSPDDEQIRHYRSCSSEQILTALSRGNLDAETRLAALCEAVVHGTPLPPALSPDLGDRRTQNLLAALRDLGFDTSAR